MIIEIPGVTGVLVQPGKDKLIVAPRGDVMLHITLDNGDMLNVHGSGEVIMEDLTRGTEYQFIIPSVKAVMAIRDPAIQVIR